MGHELAWVDYRQLNTVTNHDAYPLPQIDDNLDTLTGSGYFSALDLVIDPDRRLWARMLRKNQVSVPEKLREPGGYSILDLPLPLQIFRDSRKGAEKSARK